MSARRTTAETTVEPEITAGAPEVILNDLDPHLQEVILSHRYEEAPNKAVARSDEGGRLVVDVIAKLATDGAEVPGLQIGRRIGDIVTGAVALDDIESVRRHPNVLSLKRATELHPTLRFSVPEIEARRDQLGGVMPQPVDGAGVIVGVVDYGCDFRHQNFRKADGSTRVLFLWDQTSPRGSMSPAGFGYGREFTAADINAALATSDPYTTLAYQPDDGDHGTHVLDIAAGNGRATGHPGVAPGADIIFVQIHGGDFAESESFGNSKTLLEAVDYIFEKARQLNRSAVVNISLGTHGGPHDGSTLAEQGFDRLLQTDGRAIVISAGNSRDNRGHASGTVNPSANRSLGWQIPAADPTDNEMEVWYRGDHELEVTLVTPGGTRIGPVAPGTTVPVMRGLIRIGSVASRTRDPNNGDNQINIVLRDIAPTGTWRVELRARGTTPVPFHAWIERDDDTPFTRRQSVFDVADDDPTHTVGSISCGRRTIVVGSYDATVTDRALSEFSAEGPTRDGRQKPEVSAPGHGIFAARATTQGTTRMWGTSMASPHVAGQVALVMQAAGRALDIDTLRDRLIASVRHNPPAAAAWHARYGHGRVSAKAAVLAALPTPPGPTAAIRPPSLPTGDTRNGDSNGHSPMEDLLQQMADAAQRTHNRIRIEVEVEPTAV